MVHAGARYFNPFEDKCMGYARMLDLIAVDRAIHEDDELTEQDAPMVMALLDLIDFAKGMVIPTLLTALYLGLVE